MPARGSRAVEVVRTALEANADALAAAAPDVLRLAAARARHDAKSIAKDMAKEVPERRGQVLFCLASPARVGTGAVPMEDVLAALAAGAWQPAEIAPSARAADPVGDRAISEELVRRLVFASVQDLQGRSATTEQLMGGWAIVTGVAAWGEDGLEMRHAAALVEDTTVH